MTSAPLTPCVVFDVDGTLAEFDAAKLGHLVHGVEKQWDAFHMAMADAPLIAAAVEGTLYAVEAGAIRSSRVQAAMARLRAANTNLLGVVLTKFSAKHAQYNYNYAYDYSYEYGSKEA